ncbi:MAG: response regulator [Desulfobacteraceae bacterium]|nr:MAG: response regulator [Desulfobacteraceae bacterium]
MKTKKILVVDDSRHNIDLVIGALSSHYLISVATNGQDAISLANDGQPDLILLDVMMPEMNGYDVCLRLKSSGHTRDIPIIFLTALDDDDDEVRGLQYGAVDYITKPFNPRLLERRVKNHIALKEHRDNLELLVSKRTHLLNLTQDVTIEIAGNLAEFRDPETGGHIKRTKNFVQCLAIAMRSGSGNLEYPMDDNIIELLVKSAPLHDIGKVGVPDSVLLKPGKLTSHEFEQMKQHTIYGKNIIKASEKSLGKQSFLSIAREIAHSHHEKWDGSGYPQGLKEKEIPLSGRLMTVADVYDALTTKRVYKPAFSHDKAVAIIKNSKGKQFDPDLVDLFLKNEKEFNAIATKYAEPDDLEPEVSHGNTDGVKQTALNEEKLDHAC